MQTRQQQLDQLFTQWKNQLTAPGNFIEDGLVDEQVWNESALRLMLLLKEPNSTDTGWTYPQFINDKGYLKETATWPNLIRWTYGILHRFPTFEEVEGNFNAIKEETESYFKSVCFANVKKTAGGARANQLELIQAATESHPLLLKQIEILEPTIVLCCGSIVFEIVKGSLKKQNESFELRRTDGGLEFIWWPRLGTRIVSYHHPGAYYPKSVMYTYLMNEVRKLL